MRQLKAFMKAKKRGRCKCLTLNMWRCGEFCGCVNECGEMPEPTPPVPPVPGFTYTLEKTSTRGGGTDTYTASKYVTGEANPMKSYSLEARYGGDDKIYGAKIGDCTTECDWLDVGYGDDKALAVSYVNMTADALTTGTQEAFKSIFDAYEDYYSYDEDYLYIEEYMGNGYGNYKIYIFSKEGKEDSALDNSYALALEYDDVTGEITAAQMDNAAGSFDFVPLSDLSAAAALKAEYDAIISNPSQAACKRGYDDAEALWETISPENEIANVEIPDEVLENPTEESLDDLNS